MDSIQFQPSGASGGAMHAAPTSPARRVLGFPLTRILIAAVAFVVLQVLAGIGAGALPRALQGPMATQALSLAVALLVFLFVTRILEGRSAADAGLTREGALVGTAAGFAVGAALVAIAIGLLAVSGWYGVSSMTAAVDAPAIVIRGMLLFLLVGASEELLFRGVLFRILEEGVGSWLALGVIATAFGAVHLVNENATALGALGTGLVGILLGAAFMATRSVWLAIGIHWAWNFTLGIVFGVPVSGRDAGGSVLDPLVRGPELWTGGAFGPEAGLMAFTVTAVAAVVLLVVVVRRSKVVVPGWMRSWRSR